MPEESFRVTFAPATIARRQNSPAVDDTLQRALLAHLQAGPGAWGLRPQRKERHPDCVLQAASWQRRVAEDR